MKLSLPVLAVVLAAGLPLSACAQQSNAQENGPPGPPPEVRAQMQKARDDAKTAAFNDLSAADRAKVQSVIDQLNNGQLTDLRAAAQQIDAAITPAEQKAVLGERDKMVQTIRANMPANVPGGPPRGSEGGMRGAMHNDAGFFLLQLGVSREKMHELRQKQAPPPQQ
ncbi:MAG: hypothetical protein JO103_15855 [Candidatus Eremiobacteraeota bacterium]|nr:hypothetical protein [Candidatus Eremiobacteraeota bacterium]